MAEEYIDELIDFLKKYEGKTVDDLSNLVGISPTAKQKNYILAKALMATYEGKRMLKANLDYHSINPKTVQLETSGRPKEAMSFAPIDFQKIVTEEWETSEFKKYLLNDFILFVFQKDNNEVNKLMYVIKWNILAKDLEGEIKSVWEDTRDKLKMGDVIKSTTPKLVTNFAKEADTNICHVRDHGASGKDLSEIPVPDISTGRTSIPKQSFWFNHSYLKSIIDEYKNKRGVIEHD